MTLSQVTAATSLPGMAAAADAAASAALHTLITTGRRRHSPRAQKAWPSRSTAATRSCQSDAGGGMAPGSCPAA